MFDDPSVGLMREPFVSGIPEMMELLVAGIPDAQQGFRLLFSAEPFPGQQVELERLRNEAGGAWYEWQAQGRQGWLCSALMKYFGAPPPKLYCRAEPCSAEQA
jgi:hypothetical protein